MLSHLETKQQACANSICESITEEVFCINWFVVLSPHLFLSWLTFTLALLCHLIQFHSASVRTFPNSGQFLGKTKVHSAALAPML